MTPSQIFAILALLQAFGLDAQTIASVRADLQPQTVQVAPVNKQVAPISGGATIQSMDSLDVFKLVYEPSSIFGADLYYWGTSPLDASSVAISQDGQPIETTATVVQTGDQSKNCTLVPDNGDSNALKKCGGTSVRFSFSPALASGTYTVVLTDAEGSSYQQDITIP